MTHPQSNMTGDESRVDQLRHDIEATRAELGETVEALTEKADVKARVRDTLEEKKRAFADQVEDITGAARDIRDHFRNRTRGRDTVCTERPSQCNPVCRLCEVSDDCPIYPK